METPQGNGLEPACTPEKRVVTIRCSPETREQLHEFGKYQDTYDDILQRIMQIARQYYGMTPGAGTSSKPVPAGTTPG